MQLKYKKSNNKNKIASFERCKNPDVSISFVEMNFKMNYNVQTFTDMRSQHQMCFSCGPYSLSLYRFDSLAVIEVMNVKGCVCVCVSVEEGRLVRPEAPGLLLSRGDGN